MAEMTASQTGSLIISGAQVWDGIKQGFVERDLCIEKGLVVDPPRRLRKWTEAPGLLMGLGSGLSLV